ncbi:helix-turn-helix transcriptional regulator [Cucumibacter marinus]|uniref:helix-turn-helix transcriptional regulator n=1 Tax=Cucumibacter marinus TaxID=1121252 RepID=UPI00041DBCB2|nr:helix-turn-helix transcriptional regulator [Cucumibacter marinus]
MADRRCGGNTISSDLEEIIERIYSAAVGDTAWPDLLCNIADLGGMEHAMLVAVDPEMDRASVMAPRADTAHISAYVDHWWRHDPASPRAGKTANPVPTQGEASIEAEKHAGFYFEFLRPAGLGVQAILANLVREERAFVNFAMPASVGDDEIHSQALSTARLLSPHLRRSARISRRLRMMRAEWRAVTAATPVIEQGGVLILDAARRALFASPMAERMMIDPACPLQSKDQSIGFVDPRADAEFGAALKTLLGGRMPVAAARRLRVHGTGSQRFEIDILPNRWNSDCPFGSRPCAMVTIRAIAETQDAGGQRLMAQFGLTPKEAEIAIEVMKGDGRAAVAQRCGISVNTVRTHLERIFGKTGVRRQAELIGVLMNALHEKKEAPPPAQ